MRVQLIQGDNLAASTAVSEAILENSHPEPIQLVLWSTPYPGLRGFDVSVDDYMGEWLPRRVSAWCSLLDPVTGVYAQVVKFRRKEGWFDRRQLQITDLICDYGGMQMIDVIMWDKLNSPPSGDIKRYDHDAYEFIFLAAKTSEYTYHKWRKPYSKKSKKKMAAANVNEWQLTIFGESVPSGVPYRQKDIVGQMGGGHAQEHKEGAIQPNVFRMSATGDEKRPRVKGGSFPMKLARRLIHQYSDPGDWIADPCAGAGTSPVEAIRGGRNAIAVELVPKTFGLMAEWVQIEAIKAENYTVEKVIL